MKPSKADITPEQSCSCTSCLYRSESDRTSVRKIIARGSKIDKLYYGKYIPLRERKLLNKLVRTRAVYDDIRHQLLSGSSISVSQADLKPRKNTSRMKPGKDTQRGDDIPTLVDLVDKSNVLSSENSSECCSCCVCGSKINIRDELSKIHMHKHKRRAGSQMTSKSSVISKDRIGEETMLGRTVYFKTKHIRSDPCTCTYKFNEMMKRRSKSVLKKLRKDKPVPVIDPLAGVPELPKRKKQKAIKKSIDKVKKSKTRLVKGIQEGTRKSLININETKTKIQENVADIAKKSVEVLQETKQKIQNKIESNKYKPEYITPKTEEPTEEKLFKIRKDSLTQFREKLRKRGDLKYWECDFECDQGECVPEECFKVLKRRRLRKIKDTNAHSVLQEITSENKSDGMAEISQIHAYKNKNPKELSKRKQTTRKIETAKTKKLDRSCICVEIKKKNTKHTKPKRQIPSKNFSLMQSKTSILRRPSVSSPGAISPKPTYKKKDSKISSLSQSGVKIENFKVPTQMEEEKKEAQISHKARQAVRVGSSFSFNIELYKETPIVRTSEMKTMQGVRSIIHEKEITKSRGDNNFMKKMHKRDKGSDTTLNQSVKNIQAIGHPLKRCFCTFRLKPRKTKITLHPNKSTNKKCVCPCTSPEIVQTETESVTESFQTNKVSELPYILDLYECEPVCILGECDPIECDKRMKKRNKKCHSVSIHTKKHMKSTSSITSHSNSCVMSRGLQVQPIRKPITSSQRETAPTMYTEPVVKNPLSQRQAVRIGSTFSFQIEFSKSSSHFDSPVIYNEVLNKANNFKSEQIAMEAPKTVKGVHVAKHYISHKYSQISSSTKTKFSRQKNKLRRCFCTSKINKTLKKHKTKFVSKGTITSGQSIENNPEPKPAIKTVSMATKKIRNKFTVESHECDPGICTPRSCDPYECLELIKRRESKEMRNKPNTAKKEYLKTQSISSYAPKSIMRSRIKKVQSVLDAYKGKVPTSKLLQRKLLPKLLETPKNLNKQVVRIGSNFSFNVEFHKDKPLKEAPVKVHIPFKSLIKQQKQPVLLRERGSQIANVTRNSVLMQAISKRKHVATSLAGQPMKRCFCTLKLRKTAKEAKKDVITIGTKTQKFKNKQPKYLELEPYECEPYVCTPNLCNPYECLQRIEKRNIKLKSREIGVIAKPSKMKSRSGSGQNVHFAIKNAYAQSNSIEKIILTNKLTPEEHSKDEKPHIAKVFASKPRQSVRLGSNFSFDIEFYKALKSKENKVPCERGDANREDTKLLKNQGRQPFTTIMKQHESQVNVIKELHKATGVAPILKRCFCTLQLQKKRKHPIKPTQVYTVSRISVTKPKFIHNQLASRRVDPYVTSSKKIHRYSTGYTNRIVTIQDAEISSCDVLSCSTVQLNSQLFSQNRCDDKQISGSISSQPTLTLKSDYLKNYKNVILPKAKRSLYIRNPTPTRRIRKFSEISFIKYYEADTPKIKNHPNEVSSYLRRQFCAMNIQVDKYRSSPIKEKLKPYECEPGVCTPGECDPLVCQERIIRRIIKKTAKSSGTPNQIHSVSSTTSKARRRSTRLQSNAPNPPLKRKQFPSILQQKIGYPRSEKQAVRVGSNFSFNIEFSKKKMVQPLVGNDPTRYPSANKRYKTPGKKLRHRGTREYLRRSIERESQSNAKMEHKGSNAMPLLKRCFCTLKLHTKDGKEKRMHSLDDKKVDVNDDTGSVQIVNSTQNTEPLKYGKLRRNLESYECESGICVPGQCDPYACLELIKERRLYGKDYGTNVTKLAKLSTASMTSKQKSKVKNRCNQLSCEEIELGVQQYKHSGLTLNHSQPSRLAVHIGSTFSFNVKFFKENPNMEPTPSVPSKNMKYKTETEIKRPSRAHDFKERFTQDNRTMHHKDFQSDSMQQKNSTMTNSFIKRCFCTAKLQKNDKIKSQSQDKTVKVNVKQQSSDSPSFLQRCMCVMKSLNAPKFRTSTPSRTEQKSAPKLSYGPASHRLEPYECTPGVCVPDECDPYVCEQLIRKRNAKVCSKETCTRRLRTRSQSSTVQTYQTPKVKETQMTVDRRSKIVKPTPSGDFERRKSTESFGSPGRQAVRIGSNFNFNIEFYKDRSITETVKDKSLVDHRRKRGRTSDYSERYKPKTRSRSIQKKKHRFNQDSQVQGIIKQDRTTGISRLLQRCFCTINLGKTNDQKRGSETRTQRMRTAVTKESPNIDTKSVMTRNKLIPHKLEAYECESNTCIPGQCDPYDCEKRIKKRLRREYGTSTVQFKTKSATSMTLSARKLRNMQIQSRLKKSRRNRADLERDGESTYKKTKLSGRPAKQAIQLASNFSFNVDFFKENNNDSSVRHIPESKNRFKNVDDFGHNHKKRSPIPCNTKTCQAKTRMRELDSQVLAKKIRSTMSGVTPFLNRCFCTLKFQKPISRPQFRNENNITQPKMATDNKSTYTSKKINKSRNFARTQHLDPYECEPGVCVPGECDPYECEKLIKKGDRRMTHSVSANTVKGQGSSKYVSTRAGHKGRKSHATSIPCKRQKKKSTSSDKPRAIVHRSDFKTSYSPHRQAVRIGSNFSFDIEFYKDKIASDSPKETYQHIPTKSETYQHIPTESKKIKRFIEFSKSKTQNIGAGNRGINFYHRKSQAYGPKTEAKGSGVGPFLKRCFCTLKLHKQGKQQYQSTVPLQADYTPKPKTFDATTETMKQRRILERYECEPNVCVPGFCDPYDCLRRIKHRQMREFGVATKSPSMRSDYSLTSRRTTRDQSLKTNHFKDKRPKGNMSFHKESNNKTKRHSLVNGNSNRQAVRIGSSFKFDIEFYKQRSKPNNQAYGDSKTSASRERKQKPKKLKGHGSQSKCSPHCQGVQMEGALQQSRGSGVAPLLKRCFCTLALQNNFKQPVAEKQTTLVEEVKIKSMCTQSKYTFNKSKSLSYALDPNECEPNVCVPGECDPYDCYERIKKRNTQYISKGLGTNARRYSQASSMTTGGIISQSKRTQSVTLGKHRRQHKSSSVNKSMIVEQPRMQLLSDIADKNMVKVGSNISFNVEFYKEVTPAAAKMNYNNKLRSTDTMIDTKQKNTNKITHYRNRDSQAQTLKTQNKGSFVSNALKRCFCTAQLHKLNISPPKSDTNEKCIECRPKTIFKPQEYQVYYHKTSLYKNQIQKCVCTTCDDKMCSNTKATSTKSNRLIKMKRRSTIRNKKIQNANDMETILPYTPNKFNKKASKTLFSNFNNKGIADGENEYCAKLQCPNLKKRMIFKNRRLKKAKSTKKFNANKIKKPQPEGQDAITSTSSNFNNKSFICRCKELFSKKKFNIKNNATETCAEVYSLCKFNRTKKEAELKPPKNLKKTKSERRPTNTSKNVPKKSKSLKIKNNHDLIETRQDYSQFQSGDTGKRKKKRTDSTENKSKILSDQYKTDHLRCGDDYLYLYVTDLNEKLIKDNKKQVKFSEPNKDIMAASANLTPKSTRKGKLASKHKVGKGVSELEPMKAKCHADTGSYLDIVLQPSHFSGTQMEGIAAVSFKGDNKFKTKTQTKRKSLIKEHRIQGEDFESEDKRAQAPTPSIYRKKNIHMKNESKAVTPGASLKIAAKGSKKQSTPGGKYDIEQIIETLTKNINAIKNAKSRVLNTLITKEQICSCYSSVCECAKTIKKEKERAQKIEIELEKEKRMLQEREKMRKAAEKEAKEKHKEFLLRQKRYEQEDTMRRRKRLKENKLLGQRLKHVKTSDVLLAADSILDIAKLGCTVVGDVARSTCRFVTDPVYTCKKMKNAAKDPGSVIKRAVDDSGLVATLKRVFMRVTAMKGIKTVKSSLEENQFTGYLMKMAEDDPRKRMKLKKKKQAKKKVPALDDFECSLYMASLRRKRFLSVYYLCPWFYPHFITLLNVIQQVTDLILFLLAVFVWSPCILCMELCRAFVCCFFCTG